MKAPGVLSLRTFAGHFSFDLKSVLSFQLTLGVAPSLVLSSAALEAINVTPSASETMPHCFLFCASALSLALGDCRAHRVSLTNNQQWKEAHQHKARADKRSCTHHEIGLFRRACLLSHLQGCNPWADGARADESRCRSDTREQDSTTHLLPSVIVSERYMWTESLQREVFVNGPIQYMKDPTKQYFVLFFSKVTKDHQHEDLSWLIL